MLQQLDSRTDGDLIEAAKSGDLDGYGELFRRHRDAAMRRAATFQSPHMTSDDLVAESFTRVLRAIVVGKGPQTAFMAYLFVVMRNVFYERDRRGDGKAISTGDTFVFDVAVEAEAETQSSRQVMQEAFSNLPDRWRTILWQSQVAGMSHTEIAADQGISATATTSLISRAREGLRQAYVQAHASPRQPAGCAPIAAMLGGWLRKTLKVRDRDIVREHLLVCEHCSELVEELRSINQSLPHTRAS